MIAKANSQIDRMILERMVALLLSLANAALKTSTLSLSNRRLLFLILRPAEERMRCYVTGFEDIWDLPAWVRQGDTPEDALRLAATFRTLACALAYALARFERALRRNETDAHDALPGLEASAGSAGPTQQGLQALLNRQATAPFRKSSSRDPPTAVSTALH